MKRKNKDEMTYEELRKVEEREDFIKWKIVIPLISYIITAIVMVTYVIPEVLPFYLQLFKI